MTELMEHGKVVEGEHPIVARIGVGLASRPDMPLPDISTTEAFKQTLLNADSLIFNNVASGDYFARVLERLEIADTVASKVIRAEPAAVFDLVLQGTGNDIGVGTVPLIKARAGLLFLGPLPAEVQNHILYVAAPMTGATSPQMGETFISYLSSPTARAAFTATGID